VDQYRHPQQREPSRPPGATGLVPLQLLPEHAFYGPDGNRSQTTAIGAAVGVMMLVLVALVAVVATGIGGNRGGGPSAAPGTGGLAPADYVVSSTETTLNQHTAKIDLSGSISVDGQTVPMSGSGSADFDTNSLSMAITVTAASHTLSEDEITTAGHLYLSISGAGFDLSRVTGGKHWIDLPIGTQPSGALGSSNVDPMLQLKTLEQKGAAVSTLGASTVDGVPVTGYKVTPSAAEIEQGIQQEVRSGVIPQSAVPGIEKSEQALGIVSFDVYFDSSNMLRRMTLDVGAGGSSSAGAATATGSVDVTFSDFGAPVTIAAPAPADTIAYSQFLQAFPSAGSSPG
jgi:hypothetical protein